MALFAIGDLHLSLEKNKPMNKFGKQWENHHLKIKNNWIKNITSEDMVLVVGDISWAMSEEVAQSDLNFIKELPGKKILIKGNHDFWWNKTGYLNEKYGDNMFFMKNTSTIYKDIAIAGTRGWIYNSETSHDIKIYKREQQRLKISLENAIKTNCKKIIVMMHYPPSNDKHEFLDFTNIIELYPVEKVIYGHLHGEENYNTGIRGVYNNVEYILASSDYLDFVPLKI